MSPTNYKLPKKYIDYCKDGIIKNIQEEYGDELNCTWGLGRIQIPNVLRKISKFSNVDRRTTNAYKI